MKKVLAFFGAFNPPTKAHVDLASIAMVNTHREGVLFVPSKSQYIIDTQQKDFVFSDEGRMRMLCEVEARHRKWMRICLYDMNAKEQPPTYYTLCKLKHEQGYDPALLIGADQFSSMERSWKHVREIAQEFGIVVLTRSFYSVEATLNSSDFYKEIAPYVTVVQTPAKYGGISSTSARYAFSEAKAYLKELDKIIPREVYDYLKEEFLSEI